MSTSTRSLAQELAHLRRANLPRHAAAMLGRSHCSLQEAADFLGIKQGCAYRMAEVYRRRVGPLICGRKPYALSALLPLMTDGEWTEIPNSKAGPIRVRTDLLVPMRFPEAGWPW